ncbi:MAG: hypothetical protein JWN40_1122 [Phycisphaerales bacterium]|nr:hypothetical protein [Phycisphaerales bacterium]
MPRHCLGFLFVGQHEAHHVLTTVAPSNERAELFSRNPRERASEMALIPVEITYGASVTHVVPLPISERSLNHMVGRESSTRFFRGRDEIHVSA